MRSTPPPCTSCPSPRDVRLAPACVCDFGRPYPPARLARMSSAARASRAAAGSSGITRKGRRHCSGIKLDCVASDILGKSGRAMLDALVSGTTDPEVLADLAKGKLRAKIPALREALEGRFDHLHAVWIGAILAHLDFLDEQIASLTQTIGEQIAPFGPAVELLCTIPGVQRRTAETI